MALKKCHTLAKGSSPSKSVDCRVVMKVVSLFATMMLFSDVAFVKSLVGRSCLRTQASRSRYSSFTTLQARLPANDASMDTNLIAVNPELVISHLTSRRSKPALLDDVAKIAGLRTERNKFIVMGDSAKGTRKTLSQQIGQLMKEGKAEEVAELKRQVEDASVKAAECDAELVTIDAAIDGLFSVLPNLLDDSVPDGADEASNKVVLTWGDDMRKMGEGYLWHDEIANKLGGLDVDAAVRISGARFSVLKGSIARLERALIQYFLDFHSSRGYEEVSVPYVVSRSTLEGTGQLPKFEDDLFKVSHQVSGEDAFLIPTAEVPVTNLYRDQIIDSSALPIQHVCCTPSFRAEAGSYGRDTRGLLRQHQFHKVELVKIVTPETSTMEHEKMANDAEEVLKSLGLPYRKVLLCSGDIGFSARICYDLEVWLPGQQEYREISSISNCYDFQSRRMGLRYRTLPQGTDKKGGKKTVAYPHTLNGSGVAVGRALVAVLENYQQEDGSVLIPEKLQPYMNNMTVIKPHTATPAAAAVTPTPPV